MSSKDYNDTEVGSQGPHGQWIQVSHEFQDNPVPTAGYSQLPEVVYDRGLPEVVYDRGLPEVAYDRDALPEVGLDPRYNQYASDASTSSRQLKLDGSSESFGCIKSPPEPKSTKETRYYCSTTRRKFWICVLAALILAAAIAGGVAGGLTSAHHSSLHQPETQSETILLTTINGIPTTLLTTINNGILTTFLTTVNGTPTTLLTTSNGIPTTLSTTINGIPETGKIMSATKTTHRD
jgi:hypothetical protein